VVPPGSPSHIPAPLLLRATSCPIGAGNPLIHTVQFSGATSEEALYLQSRAIEIAPEEWNYWFNIIDLYYKSKDRNGLQRVVEKSTELGAPKENIDYARAVLQSLTPEFGVDLPLPILNQERFDVVRGLLNEVVTIDHSLPGHADIASQWVTNHEWVVVLVGSPIRLNNEIAQNFAAGMQLAGEASCFAINSEADAEQPMSLWHTYQNKPPQEHFGTLNGTQPPFGESPSCYQIRATVEDLTSISSLWWYSQIVLIPESRSWVIVCSDMDYLAIAGPRKFVERCVGTSVEKARADYEQEMEESIRSRGGQEYVQLRLDIAHRYAQLDPNRPDGA
jgi:hypothetical protein